MSPAKGGGLTKLPSPVKYSSPTKSPPLKKVRNDKNSLKKLNIDVFEVEKQRLISINNAEVKKFNTISNCEIEAAKSVAASRKNHIKS